MADLNALLVFGNVAQAGSFSGAARQMGMPVSTVSRQIAVLEDQLGLRLIERSTRSLRLTKAGELLNEQARRGMEVSETVDRLVADQATVVSGVLRLSATPGIAEALLTPIATAFGASYPDVRLQVAVASDGAAANSDLKFRFGVLADSSQVALRLLRYRKRLVASPGYLARQLAPTQPRDLAGHRLLTLLEEAPDHRWIFIQAGGDRREVVRFRPHLAMGDMAALVAAVLADGGICDLPPLIRPDLLRAGQLVEVMPEWRFEAFDLSLVHLGRRHTPRSVQLFKEAAAKIAPSLFPDLPT